jgi:hypothetical protein
MDCFDGGADDLVHAPIGADGGGKDQFVKEIGKDGGRVEGKLLVWF